jgi:hypothetical protein
MSIAGQHAAAAGFDASMTPQHKAAFARAARAAWIESGGTEETFRATFPQSAADIAGDKSGDA